VSHRRTRSALAFAALAIAALAPTAAADRVYHSEHLSFAPVGGAPLRSGFVENIKAEGPRVYAHEIFVLNGARSRATYTVTRDFFFQDKECDGAVVFHERVATLRTSAAGNARGDVVIRPEQVAGFEGEHGVRWTVRDAQDTVVYRTVCTRVTLD
jgi:hypothetical protein